MGFAQGQLLAQGWVFILLPTLMIQKFKPSCLRWSNTSRRPSKTPQGMEKIFTLHAVVDRSLPTWLADLVGKYGVPAALDVTKFLTMVCVDRCVQIVHLQEYTPDYFFEEVKGIAAGANVSYKTLYELHMFPELVKAACSMVGAWGQASDGGSLYQLRALDFITNGRLAVCLSSTASNDLRSLAKLPYPHSVPSERRKWSPIQHLHFLWIYWRHHWYLLQTSRYL